MTRYLLDTNILSAVIRPIPPPSLMNWMAGQRDSDLFIASLTLAELWRGILEKPVGRKRTELESWFFGVEGPEALFFGRILPFNQAASLIWAKLMADGKSSGRSRSPLDMIIAATAQAHQCIIVTDNERDFYGLDVVNPVRG